MEKDLDVTRTLARYIVNSRRDDIPAIVRHEASRALLNMVGCAIGSSRHETIENTLSALIDFSGAPQAAVFGRKERMDILNAALVNGISSHVFDFDDTHVRATHPSAPVYPAVLALAEWRKFSGADLVHAFVLGVEAECRVALSVFPEHYNIGWHITGTAGVFGAAAASGKLLGLNEQQMTWALGIAATQAAGLREMFGSMCKSLHPGNAARNGLMAALLASRNFTSSDQSIEAPRGFAHVTSTRFDSSIITDGLGEHFELMSNMYKPFACGLVVHAAIDGCLQLRTAHGFTPEDIERIELTINPIVLELTAKPRPRTGLEGKFSVFHAAAVAMVHGAAGEAQFSDACVRDPRVIAVRERVTIQADPALTRLKAIVNVVLKSGKTVTCRVEDALGTLARPMSDADIERKFRALADGILSGPQCDEFIRLCWAVESLPDAGAIGRAAVPA